MRVKILKEEGHEEALLGMSLSYYDHLEPLETWWDDEKKQRANKRAASLAFKSRGHNKFLESIQTWVFIQASRDFWQEFDTYRVGLTKQSSSTMHTLDKRYTTKDDFEEGTHGHTVQSFNMSLGWYKDPNSPYFKDITKLKKNLPEGWLQERVICTNYKVWQNIMDQRHGHRLKDWTILTKHLKQELKHPEYIWQGLKQENTESTSSTTSASE